MLMFCLYIWADKKWFHVKQIKLNKSVWWDDVNTKEVKELKDEIITRSFHQTITALESQFGNDPNDWKWSDALSVSHNHAFDKNGKFY